MLDHIEKIERARRPRGRRADQPRGQRRERAARRRAAARRCPSRWRWPARPTPRQGGFRVPEPGRRMSEILDLTAAQAAERVRAGELDRRRASGAPTASARPPTTSTRSPGCASEDEPPAIDTSGPLGGVPIGIKDLFCTKGIPSPGGLEDPRGLPAAVHRDRGRAAHRRRRGASLAKTNQDEFAMGSSTENSAYGPTLNPWDRTRVPGGSSGGCAAAVAAGTVPWSIGTDTGGSIRQPAALCGIVGLKPTYGAISRYGMIAFASSLDQAGPFTRDTTDAALLLQAMAGKDPCDSTSLGLPEPVAPADRDRPQGHPPRRPRGADRRGDRAGRARAPSTRRSTSRASSARPSSRCALPHAAARPRRVLPDRAGRGVEQPGPLRRRPLRPARRRPRPAVRCTPRRASRASAPRSSAASCSGPTRCRAATTTPTTAARRRCAR